MKKLLLISLTIFICACSGNNQQNNQSTNIESDTSHTEKPVEKIVEEPKKPEFKWTYDETINEMDDTATYFATIISEDELHFDFPYNGGTYARLTLRKNSSGTDIMLMVGKGQFMSNYNRDIKVRFDDDKPISYSFSEPSDNSSTAIFINSTKKFISRLKTSEKLIIQCEFYQEGVRNIKFDTKGLIWEH